LRDADIVRKLVEGCERHGMSCVVSEGVEGNSTVIRFDGVQENDCSLSVTISAGGIVLRRIVGRLTTAQPYDPQDMDEGFFELLRNHYDTIASLIKMRDKLLGFT
jgi:hypothetical protein